MTKAGGDSLTWDKNGQLVLSSHESQVTNHEYNWDGKLRSATAGPNSISLRYDPLGNRIWKRSTVSGQTTNRKYIIDISGELPTILLELDPNSGMEIKKTYIGVYPPSVWRANSQILAQHDGDVNCYPQAVWQWKKIRN